MRLPSIFEYLPGGAAALIKRAEQQDNDNSPHPTLQAAKTVGAGLVGLSGGTLLGYGAGRLAEKIHGGPIPAKYVAPIGGLAGAGFGLTYGLYKRHEAEELQRVLESQRNQPTPGVPPE